MFIHIVGQAARRSEKMSETEDISRNEADQYGMTIGELDDFAKRNPSLDIHGSNGNWVIGNNAEHKPEAKPSDILSTLADIVIEHSAADISKVGDFTEAGIYIQDWEACRKDMEDAMNAWGRERLFRKV